MNGRHPFNELTKDFTPERRQRIEAMKNKLLAEIPLHRVAPDAATDPPETGEETEIKPDSPYPTRHPSESRNPEIPSTQQRPQSQRVLDTGPRRYDGMGWE